jgi:fermentation-respiration switch protein FrsA (DUF1100 family)
MVADRCPRIMAGPPGTIERMCRRTAAALTAATVAVTLAACSPGTPDAGAGAAGGRPPAATPAPTPAASRVTAPTGRAPARASAVGVRRLSLNRGGDRPLTVTVWYPATGAPGSRTAAPGRFPVVVFSHGLGGRPADYEPLLTRWAAAGFVVAAPAYPFTSRGAARQSVLDVLNQPADASYVLTEVLALDRRAGDRLRGHLDTGRVAAAGHSAGGITTVGLFAGARDRRLAAGIVLAGNSLGVGTRFTGPAVPLLFVHGRRDEVVSYASGKALYDAVPWPKAMLSVRNGRHVLFDGDDSFPVVADSTTDFLRWSLYGDAGAKRRLARQAERGGIAAFDDDL